jgi:hypothetical protein
MNKHITPGDIPPAFVGGGELTFLIALAASLVALVVAVLVFGLFL